MDRETWNIFSHRDDQALCCAVPADYPVPPFLFAGNWLYGGDSRLAGAPGFNRRAARTGLGLNGFHLFITFDPVAAAGQAGPVTPN